MLIMKVKAKLLRITTGGLKVIALPPKVAKALDLHPLDRVRVKGPKKSIVAIVDFWSSKNRAGVFEDAYKALGIKDGEELEIHPVEKPDSVKYIIDKMNGKELTYKEIKAIVTDIVNDILSDVETTAFISAVYMRGSTLHEALYLTKSIAETGEMLKLRGILADKHCTGGVPGNRTTMVVVPIVTSLGIRMAKTSSRAITSPAGTADVMEVLANVDLNAKQIERIVKKVGGCIAWGGGTNIASADDKMIKVRNPLHLDPEGLLLASIMAKKYAVGATHVLIDIPVGEETKIKSIGEARVLEGRFRELAEMLGMKCDVIITDGNEPIGNGIGPVLEARDVLKVLMQTDDRPKDLESKSIMLAGLILELVGKAKKGKGEELARKQLASGKAWEQMKRIIKAQGGNPNVKLSDLKPAKYKHEFKAYKSGKVVDSRNKAIVKLARLAGAPATKEAGLYLHKKYGDEVKKGETLITVYSNSKDKLDLCKKLFKSKDLMIIE